MAFEGGISGQAPIKTPISAQIDNTFHLNNFEISPAEEQPVGERNNTTIIHSLSQQEGLCSQLPRNRQPQTLAQQSAQQTQRAYVTRSVTRLMETERRRQAEIERMAAERLKWDEDDGAKNEVVYWNGGIQNARVKWGRDAGFQNNQDKMISMIQHVWKWLEDT